MIPIIHSKYFENILNEEQIEIFVTLQKTLKKLNQFSNLTKLIDGDDYWISQIYDSIWPFFIDSKGYYDRKKFIDIGSGCGFPGLAYAITHPYSQIYLIDSSEKKTNALKKIVAAINLEDRVFVIKERIEEFGHNSLFRNTFDIGTTRAVSSPSTVSEYILPMLKEEGLGLIYCGKWKLEDQKKLEKTLHILKGYIKKIKKTSLPAGKGERHVIYIKPIRKCSELYPRSLGKPAKHPL